MFGGDLDRVAPLDLPVIGISMAGGGLRASIVTAGFLKGMDAREEEAMRAETGGLLQSASYLTALSYVLPSLSLSPSLHLSSSRLSRWADSMLEQRWKLDIIFPNLQQLPSNRRSRIRRRRLTNRLGSRRRYLPLRSSSRRRSPHSAPRRFIPQGRRWIPCYFR